MQSVQSIRKFSFIFAENKSSVTQKRGNGRIMSINYGAFVSEKSV